MGDATRGSRRSCTWHSAPGIVVDRVDAAAMERLSPSGKHQGVVAFAAAKDYAGLDDLLAAPRAAGVPPLIAVLDGITDPQNLGAIIRTVEGAGGHGVVIPKRRAAGPDRRRRQELVRERLEFVPVARVTNLARALRDLADAGVWSVGIDPAAEQRLPRGRLHRADRDRHRRRGQGSVHGSSATPATRSCRSPCGGGVASLNASVAAALALYEALRQREGAAFGFLTSTALRSLGRLWRRSTAAFPGSCPATMTRRFGRRGGGRSSMPSPVISLPVAGTPAKGPECVPVNR